MTTSPLMTASPILLRRWLGIGLSTLRDQAGIGQAEAATRLDVRRQTIGHYESGRNLPGVGDIEALLSLYDAYEQIERFRALREGARRGENWWQRIAAVSTWFDHYLGLESGVLEIDEFDPMYIPGVLQTEGYAEAIYRADPCYPSDQVANLVQLRTRRRHILNRAEHPAALRAVLDESVLYRRQGDRDVMAEQLRSLLRDLEHPRITLRILPLDVGAFAGQHDYPFKVLSFPSDLVGDHGVVYVELLGDAKYYEEPGEIDLYSQAMTDLMAAAASLQDSKGLIERALKETHQ